MPHAASCPPPDEARDVLNEALYARLPELDALTAVLTKWERRLPGASCMRVSSSTLRDLEVLAEELRPAVEHDARVAETGRTRGTSVLEAWCKRECARLTGACSHAAPGNLAAPYPSEMDGTLAALMRESCMDARQVVNWCSNFRKRKWDAALKPAGLTRVMGTGDGRRSTVQSCVPRGKRVRK